MLGMQILGGLLQDKPEVPPFVSVSAQDSQNRAIAGNLFAEPSIEKLASQSNQFNFDQINKMLGVSDPYANQISTQLSKNRLDWSKGVMSQDLADQVQLQSASRAVGGGYGGTGAHNALLARNYGLTSFDLQKQAQSSEESWLRTAASIYTPGMFKMDSMRVTPAEQIMLDVEERNAKFQHDWVANQLEAQYSVGTIVGQAITKTDDQITGMVTGMLGSAAGKSGGGGM